MRLILVLIVLVTAVIFSVQNATIVTLAVFGWHLEASLAVVIAVCFAIGAIIAGLALMPSLYRCRAEMRRLHARIADLEVAQMAGDPPA